MLGPSKAVLERSACFQRAVRCFPSVRDHCYPYMSAVPLVSRWMSHLLTADAAMKSQLRP